ncbi:MAG: glycosyl hydrolase family 28-related protein [Armatimonadota bacterium]|nr:glycosyl hydrolase family 28-related protein [Armatimonadota bacterium]
MLLSLLSLRRIVVLALVLTALAPFAYAAKPQKEMSVNVLKFGVKGDGVTDDTKAFQKAIYAVAKTGGGVINIPVGKYMIKGHLYVPPLVTLQGVAQSPYSDMSMEGASVLLAVEGEGNPDGPPFIFLHADCTLKGVTIFYPNQGKNGLKPYPWTISGDGDGVSIIDCFIINPWQAVDFGRHPCGRHLIRGVNMGPLYKGIFVDACYDVGRIEDVHIFPFVGWKGEVKEQISKNATAFIFAKTDWQYVTNCFSFGYKTGFLFTKGFKERTGNVVITQSGADDGDICVQVDAAQPHSGVAFNNCQFMGTVVIKPTNNAPIKFSNCGFWPVNSTDNFAYLEGTGNTTFTGCHFLDWGRKNPESACIVAKSGSLIVNGCDFMSGKTHIKLEEGVGSANIFGNKLRGGAKIINESKGTVQIGLNVD